MRGKTWNDYRLAWNESEFGGLEHVYLSTADVWIPDATLYNKSDYHSVHLSTPYYRLSNMLLASYVQRKLLKLFKKIKTDLDQLSGWML